MSSKGLIGGPHANCRDHRVFDQLSMFVSTKHHSAPLVGSLQVTACHHTSSLGHHIDTTSHLNSPIKKSKYGWQIIVVYWPSLLWWAVFSADRGLMSGWPDAGEWGVHHGVTPICRLQCSVWTRRPIFKDEPAWVTPVCSAVHTCQARATGEWKHTWGLHSEICMVKGKRKLMSFGKKITKTHSSFMIIEELDL